MTPSQSERYLSGMRWIPCLSMVLAAGCLQTGDDDLPGEVIGEFEAQGLMVQQSCGGAVPAQDPIDLEFELRLENESRAFYRLVGGNVFAGTVSGSEYTCQASQTWTVLEPDARAGFAGCSVTQRDTFSFVLEEPEPTSESDAEKQSDGETEEPGMTLVGLQATDIEPLAGSDCRPAVASFGGPFLSLPCRIEYVLSGSEL